MNQWILYGMVILVSFSAVRVPKLPAAWMESSGSVRKLEEFEEYYSGLVTEGKREELYTLCISRQLSREEMLEAGRAESSLAHMLEYGKIPDAYFYNWGVKAVAADINRDGIMDIIEYRPEVGFADYQQYFPKADLLVFLSDADDNFSSYFLPDFLEGAGMAERELFVIDYEGELFLFIEDGGDSLHGKKDFIFHFGRDGKITGGMAMDFHYLTKVERLVFHGTGGYAGEKVRLEESMTDRSVFTHTLSAGTAETAVDSPEMVDKYNKAILQWLSEQENEIEGTVLSVETMEEWQKSFCADIDNDGVEEIYCKKMMHLGIALNGIHEQEEGSGKYLTGERYGRWEGRQGLGYYMQSKGQQVDFNSLCGLDIWNGEGVPLMFWVNRVEEKNITYFLFQNERNRSYLVKGYDIHDGGFDEVVSADVAVDVTANVTYAMTVQECPYFIYNTLENGMTSPNFGGMENRECEERLNHELKEIAREIFAEEPGCGGTACRYADCRMEEGGKEAAVLSFVKYVINGSATDEYFYHIAVDLANGTCGLMGGPEVVRGK